MPKISATSNSSIIEPENNAEMNIPNPEAFLLYIRWALEKIEERLTRAGKEYGEEVLFLLGEMGAVSLTYTKASRALWSYKRGYPPEKREDTWLDLAGYAILEMARREWENNHDK